MILHGDCVEQMAAMPEASVDAIVCDPPYGLEFMGRDWDRLGGAGFHAPKDEGRTFSNASGHMFDNLKSLPRFGPAKQMQEWHQRWATEALRVAKPGAYLLAFGGTRTVHRLTCALEDAGWIIRDTLVWAYASGFPKSRALLKPAWEPIVMARKPGPLRELAIDACRIEAVTVPGAGLDVNTHLRSGVRRTSDEASTSYSVHKTEDEYHVPPAGRWPANVVLTDPIFDGGWDGVVGGGEAVGFAGRGPNATAYRDRPEGKTFAATGGEQGYGDTGTYSRFFLIPKADRAEREPVFGGLEAGPVFKGNMPDNPKCLTCGRQRIGALGATPCSCDEPQWAVVGDTLRRNTHPTVKPLELMRHLVRLVTPMGGTVLDPFLGSGTTAIAAEMEGFAWVGIEREAEYVAIAEARLMGVQRGLGLDVPAPTSVRKLGIDRGGGTRCSFFPGPCEGHPGHGKYGPTVHVQAEDVA